MPENARSHRGYTVVELLAVLALSAIVLGSFVVAYGTLVRSRTGVSTLVSAPLGSTRMSAYAFPNTSGTSRNVFTAPNYGVTAQAEELRETFLADTVSATAVFCLPRSAPNTYRPSSITYNPVTHGELDTPQKFRDHLNLILGSPASFPFLSYRNPPYPAAATPAENASIFILGFSKVENKLKVLSLYDIDVVRFTGASEPQGFYASVKRYSDNPSSTTSALIFSAGYEVFYPPSLPDARRTADWAADGFTPIFVTFERSTRLAIAEGALIDRFKAAAERPFYFIWWPDPSARSLAPAPRMTNTRDPREAYNHMGGRTSFMFTVPMFPTL